MLSGDKLFLKGFFQKPFPDTFESNNLNMQTIGKYVAAFILALASSYFGPSEADHPKEKETEIHIRVLRSSPCLAVKAHHPYSLEFS